MAYRDELLNGASAAAIAAAAAPSKPTFVVDPALLGLAERLLNDVKSGAVTSLCALIVNRTGNVQWPAGGPQALELYFGAAAFQRHVEGLLTKQNKSPIIRPSG